MLGGGDKPRDRGELRGEGGSGVRGGPGGVGTALYRAGGGGGGMRLGSRLQQERHQSCPVARRYQTRPCQGRYPTAPSCAVPVSRVA